jgi:hypothetical protein
MADVGESREVSIAFAVAHHTYEFDRCIFQDEFNAVVSQPNPIMFWVACDCFDVWQVW